MVTMRFVRDIVLHMTSTEKRSVQIGSIICQLGLIQIANPAMATPTDWIKSVMTCKYAACIFTSVTFSCDP